MNHNYYEDISLKNKGRKASILLSIVKYMLAYVVAAIVFLSVSVLFWGEQPPTTKQTYIICCIAAFMGLCTGAVLQVYPKQLVVTDKRIMIAWVAKELFSVDWNDVAIIGCKKGQYCDLIYIYDSCSLGTPGVVSLNKQESQCFMDELIAKKCNVVVV